MNQPELLELAKQGDPQSIATLINHQLNPKGILVKANTTKGCLQIIFEATEVPPQEVIFSYIYNAINKLKPPSINKVIIYGKQTGNDFPVWQQEFELLNTQSLNKQPKALSTESITPKVSKDFECHGHLTTLVIKNNGVIIKRLGGFLSPHKKGERFILYSDIINIQFLGSTSNTFGFIYFQLAGSPINLKYLEGASNQNSVVFYHDKLTEFDKAKIFVLEKTNLPRTQTYIETQPVVHQTHVVVQPVIQHEIPISCPKCGSTQITTNKKGFNVGHALVGGLVTGGVGLVAGLWGSNEIRLNCLRCGNRWKPKM